MSGAHRLGSLSVSPLAFGLWRFVGHDTDGAAAKIEAALAAGITLLDTAAVYGLDWGGTAFGESEALLGRVFAARPDMRDRVTLATKCGIVPGIPYDSSAKAIVESCEASLQRLKTGRIDLFQIHRPDLLAHPYEVAGALDRLRASGKIREAGVSNYTAAQTRALMAHLPFPLASVQPEFSALHTGPCDDGLFDLCLEKGIGVLAWSPLGGGRLSTPSEDARVAGVIAALDAAAADLGVSRETAAYAYVLAHPVRAIPILGTQRPERFAAARAALDLHMPRAAWYRVFAAARGAPLP
jgi:aryl-alcohol dehydrogenase-like predicted oxidoreductase